MPRTCFPCKTAQGKENSFGISRGALTFCSVNLTCVISDLTLIFSICKRGDASQLWDVKNEWKKLSAVLSSVPSVLWLLKSC